VAGGTTARNSGECFGLGLGVSVGCPWRDPITAPASSPTAIPGGPASTPSQAAGQCSLAAADLRDVVTLVDVHVVAGEDAAYQQVPVVVTSTKPTRASSLRRPSGLSPPHSA